MWIFGLFWVYISGCLFAQSDSNLAPDYEQGILELPKDIAVYVTAPDGTEMLVDPDDGRALLPVGTYRLQHWIFTKTDTNDNRWQLKGYGGNIRSFEISREPTLLDIKSEPVKASLTVQAGDGYILRMRLRGPAGETVYLYQNDDSSQPPPILITNQDKSFSVSLTGKYG